MMILHMLAGFGIALLSGMGVGSAGLFVLYLTTFAGLPQIEAQGLNLVFFLASAGSSFLYHLKRRRIDWRLVGFLVLCALPGARIGSALLHRLDADTLRRIFGGMLTIAGGASLLRETRQGISARRGG